MSKRHLDAVIEPGQTVARFSNDSQGIIALAAFCTGHSADLVVMEATGGLERLAFGMLWQSGMACAIANPRNVRLYAEAMGRSEKTDTIDAGAIARFAHAKDLKPQPPASQSQSRLKIMVARLGQITGDLTVNKQRLAQAFDAATKASIEEVVALLKRQSRRLEGEIASAIDDDPLWARLDQSFRTIKGVASRTVARLMAQLPEIGIYDNKAIAKLAGLAPIARDSGAKSGRRSIRGGRSDVRSILYLVADIARRYDQGLGDFHKRLTAQGKPKMVIRIALARKLLVKLNAKAREARAEFANAT